MSLKFSSIPQKRLIQGITSASTTFHINNILSFDGLTDVVPADLGTQHFCCFRNDTGTIVEFMEIDPATISTGPITILKRGLSYYGDLTTEDTDLKFDWPANTIVMLGTDVPQIFQWLKEYIDAAAIAGAVPASTSAAGIVKIPTQAQVDAGTTGDSTYKYAPPPDLIRAKKYHDYIADVVGTDAYAITVVPAITAYSAGQEFSFKAGATNTGAATLNVNSLGAKTIKKDVSTDLEDGDIKVNQIIKVMYDGTNMQLLSRTNIVSHVKFGGTGADGILSISSGTTTVNLAGARVYILNYSSISITGSGKLAFSNPHANGSVVVIKCTGDCTLTSSAAPMIDLEGIGAEAGGGGSRSTGPDNTTGDNGTDGQTYGFIKTNKGVGSTQTGGAVSPAIAAMTIFGGGISADLTYAQLVAKYPRMFVGAGGSGGQAVVTSGSGTTTAGNGGRGGGGLIMEIAGAINFTTANGISVAGQVGANGVAAGAGTCGAGGGGGGGAGGAFIFYNILTAFSGTVKVSGGVGGNILLAGGGNATGGGGGGSLSNAGNNGSSSSVNGAQTGGNGGAGLEVHGLNTEYA